MTGNPELLARRRKVVAITRTAERLAGQMGGRFMIQSSRLREFVRREKGEHHE